MTHDIILNATAMCANHGLHACKIQITKPLTLSCLLAANECFNSEMPIVLLDISGYMMCKMIGDDTKVTVCAQLVRRLHADMCTRRVWCEYTSQRTEEKINDKRPKPTNNEHNCRRNL